MVRDLAPEILDLSGIGVVEGGDEAAEHGAEQTGELVRFGAEGFEFREAGVDGLVVSFRAKEGDGGEAAYADAFVVEVFLGHAHEDDRGGYFVGFGGGGEGGEGPGAEILVLDVEVD